MVAIDERIRDRLRPLTDDELDQLVENVLQDGILAPLVVWKETGVLLDGHHRLAIAEEYGIDYDVKFVSLPDVDAALKWIDDFQDGRRNWTKEQRDDWMRQRRAEGWTYKRIADAAGVSYGTAHSVASDVQLINSDKLPGEDGKLRPARYKRVQEAQASEQEDNFDWEDVIEPVQSKKPHVSNNSGDNEWYTPSDYIEAARRTLGNIDLDPASSKAANEVVCADAYMTHEDDGLSQAWWGKVWLNPPYSAQLVRKFATKLRAEYEDGNIEEAIVLVNNATETKWFQEIVSIASAICFPSGRVRFWKPSGEFGAPLQGQAIIYIGDNKDYFFDEFANIGWVADVRK